MGGRRPRWAVLVSRVLVPVLMLGACGTALTVKRVADGAARNEAVVLRALAEVRLQDALEWRAIGGEDSAEIAAQHDASVATALALLQQASLDATTAARLEAEQQTYRAAVEREFELLAAERGQVAAEWDERQVDPAAEVLLEDLDAVAQRMATDRSTASAWTDLGLLATLLLGFGLLALVQGRLHADRARHRQQLLSEARYRAIIDQSSDLVLVCDSRGDVGYHSPAAQRVLGELATDRRASLVAALPQQDLGRLRELLAQATRNGEAGPVDLRLVPRPRDEDGSVYQFTARDLSEDPSVGGIVLTGQDVTRVRELDQAKTDFVSTVSHELRTPLTSICGYLELVREEEFTPLPDELRVPVATIDRNARRLLGLVEQLLFLSGLENAPFAAATERVDLVGLVGDLVTEARVVHAGRRIDLDATGAPGRAEVLGVRDDLGRVVLNVLSNALKFSLEDTVVTVTVTLRPDAVEVRVADHGIGIPVEEQDRLFGRFFRSSLAQRRAIPGTGLGLAVCKAVVEAHAGIITIDSGAGEGTTVTVRLPPATDLGQTPAPGPGLVTLAALAPRPPGRVS